MGLKSPLVRFSLPFLLVLANLSAAPKLRLSSAAVGPVSIAVGANGAAQTVQASNIGDGSLSLTVSASDTWLAPAVAGSSIQIGLSTSGLAKGIYTGIVTVGDPNALDAPQDITVTVMIGGGVPDQVDLYAPPDGSTREIIFTTNSVLNVAASTKSGGSWLAVSLTGTGSFRFSFPYRIAVTASAGLAEGPYNGTIVTSGSSFAPDNKSIAVVMHVTSGPIAQATPDRLAIRLAQGAPQQLYKVAMTNAGMGELSLAAVNTNTMDGGGWLSSGLGLQVAIEASTLSPGNYQGTVSVLSNAANGPTTIPVKLQVVPQSPPVVTFQGVVDSAIQQPDALAQGGRAMVLGEQFSTADAVQGAESALTTELGGAQVLVNDQPAPIFSSSYGQIEFQIPFETPAGPATVRVARDGQPGNAVAVDIVPRAPRLLRLGIGDYGRIVNQDGSFALPATDGTPNHPAHAGDQLVISGIGFGQTNPPASTGQPAPSDEPLARLDPLPNVTFGGLFGGTPTNVQALSASLVGGSVGLYQITVIVPDDAPTGAAVPLFVDVAGTPTNTVRLAIQ